jgi:hypothetical protein
MITSRPCKGQAMIVLGLLIAFFVLLIVGLFSFEINRAEVARQQLRSACDAAALAGAATLASQDSIDPVAAHTAALNTALNTFQQNSVAGATLSPAVLTYSNPDNPNANQSSLFIEFLDPRNNNQVVNMGNPNGKIVRATGNFGLEPAFGRLLGLGNVPIHAVSSGGVPMLDVVLCFDVSGSIDDQTPVTFVRRRWNTSVTPNRVTFDIPTRPAGGLAQGTIYNVLVPVPTGSAVNALPPQQLSSANSGNSSNLRFSEAGGSPSAVGLRGTNTGALPGNAPGMGGAGIGDSRTFTDLVVNIDGRTTFQGITSGLYAFPTIGTVVEAARGNLETQALFNAAGCPASLPNTVTPRAGYQAEYVRLAMLNIHPLKDAQIASQEFLTIMNTNTDAHFCLVSFSTNAGNQTGGPLGRFGPLRTVDQTYTGTASQYYPQPLVPLSNSVTGTKYTECSNALPPTVATGATNIGDAVNTACSQLQAQGRPGAKKAIIVFTDGQPTQGGPLNSDPWTNARQAAVVARNRGIPIYTIGLAQTPAIIPGETAILNDTNNNVSNGGIAAIAGFGGKFFLVTDVNDLRKTFENIARQLVSLVK